MTVKECLVDVARALLVIATWEGTWWVLHSCNAAG